MTERAEWITKAITMAEEEFDIVYDMNVTENFVEVSGNIGGDLLRYRYYKSGVKTEK